MIVIGKGEDISLAVDGPIFGGETVIDLIELILCFAEVQRVILMGLDADDLQQRGTDFAQALDTGRLHASVGLGDQLVLLAVVDFAVLHHKGKIPGPFGGVLIIVRLFLLRFLQRLHIRLRAETGVQAFHRAGEVFIQIEIFRRDTGRAILIAVHIPAALHLAHEHFRVVHEVAVVGNPFSPFHVCLYPRWGVCPVKLYGDRPLFQKDNIRSHFGSRQRLERRIGQTDGADELCPSCDIFPQALVLSVQDTLAGDKGDDAARFGKVQGLDEKVVVDIGIQLIVAAVVDFDTVEGDVAQDHIEAVVLKFGGLIAHNGNIRLWIELLCNTPGDGVQLHAVQLGSLILLRQNGIEIAGPHAGVKNPAVGTALKPEPFQSAVHIADQLRLGVVGGDGGAHGRLIFFLGQQGF